MKLTYEYNGYVHPDRLVKPRIAVSVDIGLATRLGVTDALPHVIEHVRSVFKAAALALAGKPYDHVEAYSELATLPEYDGSIVNVWGDLQIPTQDGGLHVVGLNVCDERVSSREIVDNVNMLLEALNPPPRHDRPSVPRKPAPAPADDGKPWHTGGGGDRTVYKPDGKADLKKTFPRGGNGDEPAPVPPPTDAGDTPHVQDFTYKSKDEYARLYGGSVIAVDITKFIVVTNRYGKKHLEVYSTYNGHPSKYPQHPLNIHSAEYIKHNDTVHFVEGLLNREPGHEETGAWRAVYYVNATDGGKVYFNLNKIEAQDAPTATNNDAPQLPGDVNEISF